MSESASSPAVTVAPAPPQEQTVVTVAPIAPVNPPAPAPPKTTFARKSIATRTEAPIPVAKPVVRPAPVAQTLAAAEPAPPVAETPRPILAEVHRPSTDAPAPVVDPEPVKPPEPAPDVEEKAYQRQARLNRAEAKFQRERAEFAQTKRADTETLKRVEILNKASEHAKRDPIAILKALGITPETVLNAQLGTQKEFKPQERIAEVEQSFAEKMADIEKRQNEWLEQQKVAQQEAGIRQYVERSIIPVISPPDAYPYTKFAYELRGEDLATAIFQHQKAIHAKTGQIPSAKDIADVTEKSYREKAEKRLGSNAKPVVPPASSPGIAPPQQKPGASAEQPQTAAVSARRKATRPYVTKVVIR